MASDSSTRAVEKPATTKSNREEESGFARFAQQWTAPPRPSEYNTISSSSDTNRSFRPESSAPSEATTHREIGAMWDRAVRTSDPNQRAQQFANVDRHLVSAVQREMRSGTSLDAAITKVGDEVDKYTNERGGPLLQNNEGRLKISHIIPATGQQNMAFLKMTKDQLDKLGVIRGAFGSGGVNDNNPYTHGYPALRPRSYDVSDARPEANLANHIGESAASLSREFPSPYVLGAALNALRDKVPGLSDGNYWNATNAEQKFFADTISPAARGINNLPNAFKVEGAASIGNPDRVNKFLRDHGFTTQLENSGRENSLYAAGTLSITGDWNAKASKLVGNDLKTYDSIVKDGKVHTVNGRQIAEIHNQDGVRIFAVPAPSDMPGYEVNQRAQNVVNSIVQQERNGVGAQSGKVEFPMVDMNSKQDLTGLLGMQTRDAKFRIDQAKVETKLKMNETGFSAKQAAAVEVHTRSFELHQDPIMQVKDKFIFVAATSAGAVVFASHVKQENWKRPRGN